MAFVLSYYTEILMFAGACAVLGLLAFVLFRTKLYRALSKTDGNLLESGGEKSMTVIICCHNEGDALETNLPKIMEQRSVKFEVVVVDDCPADSTPEVLKRMENRYSNLRHTFVPVTARYVSHAKLAVSLGVKAARHEWIVMTRPTCAPVTDLWLKAMSSCFAEGTDIVLGYANYADDDTLAAGRAVFERMQYNMTWYLSARHKACGGDGGNMAFRRSLFLECDGYADSLDRVFGDDDLLVNAMSTDGNTAVCCAPIATIREYPNNLRRAWRRLKLVRTASFMHTPRRGNAAMMSVRFSNIGHYLWAVGWILSAATFFACGYMIAGTAVCLAAILMSVADALLMKHAVAAVGERNYLFLLWWYETVRPLVYPVWKLKVWLCRRDFKRHI